MSELYDRIVSQRGSLERLIMKIPGFQGYMDNKARRTADRMVREHVAGELSRRISRLVEIEKLLLEQGGLSSMSYTLSVKTKLQTFRDRVNAAAPGYSGALAEIKIGPEEMERLYSFDEALVRYVDQFDEALNKLAQAVNDKKGIEEALDSLDKLTIEANDALSLRDDVLTNLTKTV
jgi:hypothetical protein